MSRRSIVLASLVLAAVVLATMVAAVAGDDDGPEPAAAATIGGRDLDRAELRALLRETMGVADLDDVPEAGAQAPTMRGAAAAGVRRFELRAAPVRWEYRDGQHVTAWAYEGSIPGPQLRAVEGERVEVTFRNDLPVATTVHWHGVDVPWQQDGVPGVTQQAIDPGDEFTYTFTATPAGTRWYHTHGSEMGDETPQLDMGLSGALVIEPRQRPASGGVDRTLVLDEWNIGPGGYNAALLGGHASHGGEDNVFTIDGKAAPDIADLVVRRGQRVRIRWVNASSRSYHPMHVHGHQFRIVALDGNPVPTPVERNVALLAPGETADIEFVADNPGVWSIHCHDLHHADAGMMMLLRYEGFEPVEAEAHGGDANAGGGDEEHDA